MSSPGTGFVSAHGRPDTSHTTLSSGNTTMRNTCPLLNFPKTIEELGGERFLHGGQKESKDIWRWFVLIFGEK